MDIQLKSFRLFGDGEICYHALVSLSVRNFQHTVFIHVLSSYSNDNHFDMIFTFFTFNKLFNVSRMLSKAAMSEGRASIVTRSSSIPIRTVGSLADKPSSARRHASQVASRLTL